MNPRVVTVGCRHWSGTAQAWCGQNPTRRYLPGDRCAEPAPEKMRAAL